MDCLQGLEIETVGREDLNWFEEPPDSDDEYLIEEEDE